MLCRTAARPASTGHKISQGSLRMKKLAFVSLAALALATSPLSAQPAEQVTVIHAGRLLDRPPRLMQ